jgi:hypothetical protein
VKNAHPRFGRLTYIKSTEKATTNIKLRLDRFIGEVLPDPPRPSEEEIARSLEGHWQEDLLFVLQQEQDGYEFCQNQMAECDRQLNR